MPQSNFETWMDNVDRLIKDVTGCFISEDLPDYPYGEAFDEGRTSKEVAVIVLQRRGFNTEAISQT